MISMMSVESAYNRHSCRHHILVSAMIVEFGYHHHSCHHHISVCLLLAMVMMMMMMMMGVLDYFWSAENRRNTKIGVAIMTES